ncbi:MAG TPA: cytidine deaminase [Gammaproteobacteria bacterium]|nr:cytidine deaminase [Gammaproteobacteria bacterium]
MVNVMVEAPENSKQPVEELVIGMVGPVGANLSLVQEVIESEFGRLGYQAQKIRVSSLLHQLADYSYLEDASDGSEFERIKKHMEAGTGLRTKTKQGDVMAMLAISRIRQIRKESHGSEVPENERDTTPLNRTVYILRSLKHPDEIETLRDVYGSAFIVVSAYVPREERVSTLAEVLAASENDSDIEKYRASAEELINIDEQEEGQKLGQDVSDAFPLADFFVDARSKENLEVSIRRFLETLFGYPYHTPTRDEFGMYLAQAAAMRSSDLSRQVGAAITTKEGEVIALGANDIPKAYGGLYWCDDEGDSRDFRLGYDSNAKFKREIVAEIIGKLKSSDWLAGGKSSKSVQELADDLLSPDGANILGETQITNLLEFGRSVHAEMAALTDAAKRGIPVQGATLYTTTFPCHLCARHIISAGISRVVYVQPYPKSQTKRLYSDSVAIDPPAEVKGRIQFEPFVGVAPTRYRALFRHSGKRKDSSSGKTIEWTAASAVPNLRVFVTAYLLIEEKIVGDILPQLLSDNGIKFAES